MDAVILGSRLLDAAKLHEDRLALWIGGVEYSYRALFDTACTLAAELQRTTAADASIGILGQQSFSSYVGILAAMLCGRPYVPVNPFEPYERQRMTFEIAPPAVLICDPATQEVAARHQSELDGAPAIYIADGVAEIRKLPDQAVPSVGLDTFSPTGTLDSSTYILFTSGTTGKPKGVRILQRNVLAYMEAIGKIMPLRPDDRCTQLFALTFDLSVHDTFYTWLSGASVWVMLMEDQLDRLAFVRKHGITSWYSVPVTAANAQRLGQIRPNAAPTIRYSSFCGEALPTSVALAWQEACPNAKIFNLYGPTEATLSLTYCEFDPNSSMVDSLTVPIGRAQHGQFAIAVDEKGMPVPPGAEGELMLGGSQVSPGYTNNPEANATRFFETEIGNSGKQRWYRTGDWVLNDPEHGLVFKRRMDDQMKVGGYRVEMQEIEAVLREASGTPTVAVVPWQLNGVGGANAVVGFVCGSDVPHKDIIRRCQDFLPKPLVPRKLIDLEDMPTNASGKIDRKVLKALIELPQRAAQVTPDVPRRVA